MSLWWYWRHFSHLCMLWFHPGYCLFILLCDWMIHGCEIMDSAEVHCFPFYCCVNAENAGCECPYLHAVIASRLWLFLFYYVIEWYMDAKSWIQQKSISCLFIVALMLKMQDVNAHICMLLLHPSYGLFIVLCGCMIHGCLMQSGRVIVPSANNASLFIVRWKRRF